MPSRLAALVVNVGMPRLSIEPTLFDKPLACITGRGRQPQLGAEAPSSYLGNVRENE
jgi:hypothetical protein